MEASSEVRFTAFEALQLANEFNGLGATYFALYVTLVSGYLVTAFLAGERLTLNQLRLINSIFVLSAAYFVFSTMSMWIAGLNLYRQAISREWMVNSYLTAGFNLVLGIAMLVGIFASIKFMQDVRRTKKEDQPNIE